MARNVPVKLVRAGVWSRLDGPGCIANGRKDLTVGVRIIAVSGPSYGHGGMCDAYACSCRRCLREDVTLTQKKRHGDRDAARARLRKAAAARQAASERAQKAKSNRARSKRHKQRRRKRDAKTRAMYQQRYKGKGTGAPGGEPAAARTTDTSNKLLPGAAEQGDTEDTATALKQAEARGKDAVVTTLTSMIRDSDDALWRGAGGAPDPEVEAVIASHYNDLEAPDKFELLMARMSQPAAWTREART